MIKAPAMRPRFRLKMLLVVVTLLCVYFTSIRLLMNLKAEQNKYVLKINLEGHEIALENEIARTSDAKARVEAEKELDEIRQRLEKMNGIDALGAALARMDNERNKKRIGLLLPFVTFS